MLSCLPRSAQSLTYYVSGVAIKLRHWLEYGPIATCSWFCSNQKAHGLQKKAFIVASVMSPVHYSIHVCHIPQWISCSELMQCNSFVQYTCSRSHTQCKACMMSYGTVKHSQSTAAWKVATYFVHKCLYTQSWLVPFCGWTVHRRGGKAYEKTLGDFPNKMHHTSQSGDFLPHS